MKSCKKYRAKANPELYHARNTEGNCQGCVYFSKANCRNHVETVEAAVAGM